MNIYKHELKSYFKSILIWSVSMVLLIASGMSEQQAFATSGSSINEWLDSMPKILKAFMGGGAFDPTTPIGYYSMIYLYLMLMTTIHAVMIGVGIITKEEKDKTYEFLMTKPISRLKLITYKLLAALTNVIIFNLVTFIVSAYYVNATIDIFKLMIGMFLIQILFMSLGSVLAAIRYKTAIGIGTGILLFTFFLSTVIDLVDNKMVNQLRVLTPFKYFDPETLLIDQHFSLLYVLMTIVLTGIFTYFTLVIYNKRDLGH